MAGRLATELTTHASSEVSVQHVAASDSLVITNNSPFITANISVADSGGDASVSDAVLVAPANQWVAEYTIADGTAIGASFSQVSVSVTDVAGNTSTFTDSSQFAVDNIRPNANITLVDQFGNPVGEFTNNDTVYMRADFNEPVTGVGVEDFSLEAFSDDIHISSVTPIAGQNSSYLITVTGSGLVDYNGDLGIDFSGKQITAISISGTAAGTDTLSIDVDGTVYTSDTAGI